MKLFELVANELPFSGEDPYRVREGEQGGDEIDGSPEVGDSGGLFRRVLNGFGFSGEVFNTHFI